MNLIDAAFDLLLQGVCPGCGLPGRGLCPACVRLVGAGRIGLRYRPGLHTPLWSAGEYAHPLPRIISQAKDHHRWDAIPVLGRRLALAVAGLVDDLKLAGPGLLVPFPSTDRAVRERGLDFTQALAAAACGHVRRIGVDVRPYRLLTHVRAVDDQGGLTSAQRQENLWESLAAVGQPAGWIILADDVVTTGASLREGVRALCAVGHPPVGLATVAATTLRA